MQVSEMYNECVRALKNFADSARFKGAVIGLSGGIDSSVVACMCTHAFGAENVLGIMLPGPYSTEHSLDDAKELASNLGIEVHKVSISETFATFKNTLANTNLPALNNTAIENTQARIRMVVLMALSNATGKMLVNTGNKSEAMMGYSTLYGDTAGAFAPIGGLYKTSVFKVARFINRSFQENGKCAPIPGHVLVKPPSAELSSGQTDEASLGISYELLDKILVAYFEHGKPKEWLVGNGFSEKDVSYVLETASKTNFKRAMEPPFPKAKFYQ